MSWNDSQAVAADLKPTYQTAPLADTETVLEEFAEKCDEACLTISQVWGRH